LQSDNGQPDCVHIPYNTIHIGQHEIKIQVLLHNTPFIYYEVMSHSKSSFVHKTRHTIPTIQTKRADGTQMELEYEEEEEEQQSDR